MGRPRVGVSYPGLLALSMDCKRKGGTAWGLSASACINRRRPTERAGGGTCLDVGACVTSSPGAWPRQRSCGPLVGATFRSDLRRAGGPAAHTRGPSNRAERGQAPTSGARRLGNGNLESSPTRTTRDLPLKVVPAKAGVSFHPAFEPSQACSPRPLASCSFRPSQTPHPGSVTGCWSVQRSDWGRIWPPRSNSAGFS